MAADGTTKLYGVLYKPTEFDPDQSYPVIDSQYASPLTAVVPRNFMMALIGVPSYIHPASLAALQFVGVAIDARGTTYRSKEFSHYSYQNLNTIGLEDHVAVIQELAQTRPWMDVSRVGIQGGSYGGFTVFRAMFEFPEFYKVGISGAGVGSIHNMYPDYHWEAYHGKAVYADDSTRRPTPTDRPVNYVDNDATIQANNLQGKLLIMLGELDENVFPATTLAVVDSLIKLDKDFDMLYVPNRPHNFISRHVTRRCMDYFVRHLHGIEPPAYEIKSQESEAERQWRRRVNAASPATDE
jgi:dipeptidyl aminopeptidase/acylaminoacyl peptidase